MNKDLTHKVKAAVKPTKYLDYRDYLRGLYRFLKAELKSYSYVSFAEDFGFSKTNVMHLVIQGKRPLTGKAAQKIAETLSLAGVDRQYFECLVDYQNERDPKEREELFRKLLAMKGKTLESKEARAQLEFFSEWFHPAIYEMVRLPDFSADPKWIADRLQVRVRPEQVRKSLQLLESLHLIIYNHKLERYETTESHITTGDEVASVAVVRYHQALIDMGKESITRVTEKERDISAITVAVSMDVARKMKEEISVFRKKMLALAEESEQGEAVYQMNIQLFPLTKVSNNGSGS